MARTQRLFCTSSHHLGIGKGSPPCEVAWQREFSAVVRGFCRGWAIVCECFLSLLVHFNHLYWYFSCYLLYFVSVSRADWKQIWLIICWFRSRVTCGNVAWSLHVIVVPDPVCIPIYALCVPHNVLFQSRERDHSCFFICCTVWYELVTWKHQGQ